MRIFARVFLLLIAAFAITLPGYAAWGDYDTTFGFLGVSLDGASSHYPTGVAVQADGKILVTGYRLVSGKQRFFLRRYTSSGQLDTSFGNNGSAISNALIVVDASYRGERIVVQSNGKIAVLGVGNLAPAVWRFHASGNADTSIGFGGMRTLSGYHPSYTRNFATYANILYLGLTKADHSSGAVIKFNSDGTRDMAFGNGGELIPSSYHFYAMSVESSTGNVLVGGKSATSSSYGIERFLPSGQLDATFERYDTTYQGAPGLYPSSFINLANGRFVLNETWYPISQFPPPTTTGANLVHFMSNGSYTSRTEYVTPVQGPVLSGPCPNILDQQSDGRVIAKSVHYNKLYRFSTNFSTVSTMTCSNYASIEGRTEAVLQADDKMIAAGRYSDNIAIVRTLP